MKRGTKKNYKPKNKCITEDTIEDKVTNRHIDTLSDEEQEQSNSASEDVEDVEENEIDEQQDSLEEVKQVHKFDLKLYMIVNFS
jgi:hypothetical protein